MADMINHPPHYNTGKFETIDIIHEIIPHYESEFAYDVGCVIKYLSRAPHKNSLVDDLKKAQWYMNHLVTKVSEAYGRK